MQHSTDLYSFGANDLKGEGILQFMSIQVQRPRLSLASNTRPLQPQKGAKKHLPLPNHPYGWGWLWVPGAAQAGWSPGAEPSPAHAVP